MRQNGGGGGNNVNLCALWAHLAASNVKTFRNVKEMFAILLPLIKSNDTDVVSLSWSPIKSEK